ncbi:Tab2/Atab2 family RNA-binding protein [Nodosilinea sp. LEGE 06152]|uniref:Tab2/Atab2 family RNA-binding protein n=1 Tax=Nodosilinea sp. LEGE 06152 TaxID=2777966 RepID=UPI00187F72B1|nr:Tab2/Atab2 family RNA-binding protein [Nodosilinea sp. LEGE 06152]MBE9158557.1 Tab2/Atab2 family RNA-binding protein [Nodosilinea sp. LEGE 06152]
MGTVWELDFYSRPVLDENQKKLWEVLLCEGLVDSQTDSAETFRYSKFLPSSEVNSITLKGAIEEAIAEATGQGIAPPSRIRFFRYQMQNMILRACEDAGLPARPSRRTLALQGWLRDRNQTVYPQMEGYTTAPSPSVAAPPPSPQPLPDALLGQKWAFVSLEAAAFADLPEWDIGFGETFPLALAELAPDTPIPGLLIFSPRATALAAWMSGLELAYWRIEAGKNPAIVLETGAADSWILAGLPNPKLLSEAQAFEAVKAKANQVHFIGVQASPESESFAGFWLLQELPLG